MPRVSPILTNFTAGEFSPKMYGRVDLAQYINACRKMQNFVISVQGGAQRRPGTKFIAEVKDSSKKVRLIPFQYSIEQAYVIELGDYYARFLKDQGQILSGSDPYEIAMPYPEAQLPYVRFAQDKDLQYFFNRSYAPRKLTRSGHTSWAIEQVTFEDGPYLAQQAQGVIGDDLMTNGTMEANSNWTSVGSPLVQERSTEQKYEGTYSRKLLALVNTDGVKSDTYTTTTGLTYRVIFRIYTAAETFTLKIHQGNVSGTFIINETITGVPVNEWTEYERYYVETSGGANAYFSILGPAVVLDDTELIPNGDMEAAESWSCVTSGLTATHNSSNKHSGSYSYSIWTGNIPNATLRGSHFYTETGKWYKFSFWVYTPTGVMHFKIRKGNDSGYITETTLTGIPANTWTKCSFNYKETAGGGFAEISFVGTLVGMTNLTWYWDDVSIKEIISSIYIDKVEINNIRGMTMTPSATTGYGITLTASEAYFESGHIGAFFRLTHDTTGYVKVVSITSSTIAVVDVISPLGDTTSTTEWQEGAWSTKNGFPACGAFYEQRLIVGSSANDPDTIWGSKVTEYEDFTPGVLDTDSFSYKLQSDIIRWLAAMGQLIVGSVNAEFRMGSGSSDTLITPTTVKVTQQTAKGSANIEPVSLGNSILFLQRYGDADNDGKKIREMSYAVTTYGAGSYDSTDLSIFASHITGSGIVDMAFMSSPQPILWCVTADGELIGMTYEREQKVIGWHRHPMSGFVESICVIPGANQDDLYLVVRHTIDGQTKRYIEVMADFDWGTDQEDCFFVDCGMTYDGSATTTLTGLDHLEGETVSILADGAVHPDKVVSSGSITLDYSASKVHVGLSYTSDLETLDLEGGSVEGTAQGKIKRIHSCAVRFIDTVGGYIGADASNLDEIIFRSASDPVGEPTPLYDGIKDVAFPGGWETERRVLIRQTDPLPMTVLSIMPRFRTEDK